MKKKFHFFKDSKKQNNITKDLFELCYQFIAKKDENFFGSKQ